MKALLSLLVLLVFCTFKTQSQPNLAVEYRFENGDSGTLSPHYVNPSLVLSASDMYFGPGLGGPAGIDNYGANIPGYGCSCQPTDRAAWANNWGTIGLASPPDMDDYFGISITPVDANPLVIDSITWWSRRAGNGPRFIQVRSSFDSYSSTLWTSALNGGVMYVKDVATFFLPTFGTTTDFRLYGYAPSSPGQGAILRIDSIKVYAHVDLGPLPITLLSFTGEAKEGKAHLSWQTASEESNDHFRIERSVDLSSWEVVGRVDGAGTSHITNSYELVDSNPFTGTNYYKLTQVDEDGTEESFNIVVINFTTLEKLTAYPNPARVGELIRVSTDAIMDLTVHDATGRHVNYHRVDNGLVIDQPGQYLLSITTPSGVMRKRVVVE